VYELSGTSLLIFGSTRPGIVFYSLVFLPGTIIHELSHWIVAEILQVRTGAITIFPDLEGEGEGDNQRLGSVATARSDPFRGFLIGLAPFMSGLAILAVLGKLLSIGWAGDFLWWQLALIIYGIMVIGNSMMISESDRRTWPFIIIFFLLITILFMMLKISVPPTVYDQISSIFASLDTVLGVTAGLNLVMIGGSYGLRRLIEKITKIKIVHN
jgi:hypothetical protein